MRKSKLFLTLNVKTRFSLVQKRAARHAARLRGRFYHTTSHRSDPCKNGRRGTEKDQKWLKCTEWPDASTDVRWPYRGINDVLCRSYYKFL